MALKDFFPLYWRNIKGTFFGGFRLMDDDNGEFEANYAAGLAVLGHILLLPITLTIGALIKTLIDFNTRKPIPKEAIASKKDEIDHYDVTQMLEFINKISQYNTPFSNSSAELLSKL